MLSSPKKANISFVSRLLKKRNWQTHMKPTLIYLLCIGKRSYGGSTTWEPRNIWYRVWHCPSFCRMRRILYQSPPAQNIDVRTVRFYFSCTSAYSSVEFFYHAYTVIEGRHIFRLTTTASSVGIDTRPTMQYSTALKKYIVNDLISGFSGCGGCFALG